jgi:hypothetical protein
MDASQFKQLLDQGQELEAQKLLERVLADAITPEQQGEVLLAMAAAYMDAENTINEEHIRILKKAVAELVALNKQEEDLTSAIELVKARKTIDQS